HTELERSCLHGDRRRTLDLDPWHSLSHGGSSHSVFCSRFSCRPLYHAGRQTVIHPRRWTSLPCVGGSAAWRPFLLVFGGAQAMALLQAPHNWSGVQRWKNALPRTTLPYDLPA